MQVETNESTARDVGSCHFCRRGWEQTDVPILELELIRPAGNPSRSIVTMRICAECAPSVVTGLEIAKRRVMDWKEKNDVQ